MVHIYSSQAKPLLTASVIGARGYSGLELVRLLLNHPAVDLCYGFATKPFRLSDDLMDERAAHVRCLTDADIFNHLTDVVFLATPAEVSADLAPKLLAAGKIVIDLSNAFRFKPEEAEYGLAPFCGPWPRGSRLVANPGCYASAINLALVPLLKHGLIRPENLAIDAKSGTSGAGRKAAENQLFAEVYGECQPYRVGQHQHLPEIVQAASRFAGQAVAPHFVTHLLPVKRGITAALFAELRDGRSLDDVEEAYAKEFSNYRLVRYGRDLARLTRLSHVVHTPYTHISYTAVGSKLYVFSCIDNLLKGAASQAVENLNRFLDLPLTHSLIEEE